MKGMETKLQYFVRKPWKQDHNIMFQSHGNKVIILCFKAMEARHNNLLEGTDAPSMNRINISVQHYIEKTIYCRIQFGIFNGRLFARIHACIATRGGYILY